MVHFCYKAVILNTRFKYSHFRTPISMKIKYRKELISILLSLSTVNGDFTEWTLWGLCSMNCGKGISTRSRTCKGPKCGGTPCDPKALTKEVKTCYQECPGMYLSIFILLGSHVFTWSEIKVRNLAL